MDRLWIHGITGKMGREIAETCKANKPGSNCEQWVLEGGSSKTSSSIDLSKGLSHCNLLLDFSSSIGNQTLLDQIIADGSREKKILIGSTGLNSSQVSKWEQIASVQNLTILHAVNTSLGIYLTLQAALNIASVCNDHHYDIELEETHHRGKIDSPSGTASYLAHSLGNHLGITPNYSRSGKRQEHELGVQVTRGGGVFGDHKIRFLGDHDEITISHRAFSRDLFVKGAFVLAKWLKNKTLHGFFTLADIKPSDLI